MIPACHPFEAPVAPVFSGKKVSVTDFGAVSGGKVLCTDAFRDAMLSLGSEGGTVVVPAGRWLSGAIHFLDNIELHLEDGAEILFSPNLADYLPAVLGVYEGIRCYRPSAMLHAEGKRNVAVTGKGLLNGNGAAFWEMVYYTAGPRDMIESAKAGRPVEERVYTKWEQGVRPCFLEFLDCENVLIEDVTFKDSPMWTVHPTWCRNVTVRGISIDNPMDDRFHHSPNTDGVNLDGCRRALVENCTIYCGDDCVCMKSGKNEDGRASGHICEDVEVRNCHFIRGIGGITIGSETSGSIRNLYCHDIDMKDITIGIWVKSTPERGGFIEDLHYENIVIEEAAHSGFCIMLGYDNAEMNGQWIPPIRNISAENVTLKDGKAGVLMNGIPGHEPHDIRLKNFDFYAEKPLEVTDIKNVTMENCSFKKNPSFVQRY